MQRLLLAYIRAVLLFVGVCQIAYGESTSIRFLDPTEPPAGVSQTAAPQHSGHTAVYSVARRLQDLNQSPSGLPRNPVERLPLVQTTSTQPGRARPAATLAYRLDDSAFNASGSRQEQVSEVSLSLQDLEQMAWRANPTLSQAWMRIRAAQGGYVQAGLYPNPVAGYIADDMGNDGRAGVQGAGLAQEIVTTGKLRLGRSVAGWEVRQARFGLSKQQYAVLNAVRIGYYETLVAQRTVEVNEKLVAISDEFVQLTEKLGAAKEVSQADVLQARIEAEQTDLNLVTARHRYQTAWGRLAATIGHGDMAPTPLSGEIERNTPNLQQHELLNQILEGSPELAAARAAVQRARCNVALQCAERIPNFEISTAVKRDYGSEYTIADFGLAMPIPIYNRNQGNIVSAQAELTSAVREVRRIELDLHARFIAAFEEYAIARQHVQSYTETILPNARKSLQMIKVGYQEGEFDYLKLLTAQRTYFSANLEYLSNLGELWTQSVELEGMLVTGGLERPE